MSVVSRLEPWPSPDELASVRRSVLTHVEAIGGARGSSGGRERDAAKEEVQVVAAPYRVCPLGAHIDHQGGVVAGLALNCGVMVGFVPTPEPPEDDGDDDDLGRSEEDTDEVEDDDGRLERKEKDAASKRTPDLRFSSRTVCLVSDAFDGEVRFDLDDLHPPGYVGDEEGNWGAYARGAAWALRAWLEKQETDLVKRRLARGIVGVVHAAPSGVDRGGISSSAAVGIAMLMALEKANGMDPHLDIDAWENILLGQQVENGYLGLRTGVLDQASVMLSRRTALTLIDCKRASHTHEPFGCDPGGDASGAEAKFATCGEAGESDGGAGEWEDKELPFVILLAFSGLREALTATGYNQRVVECRSAAASLAAMAAETAGWSGPVGSAPPASSIGGGGVDREGDGEAVLLSDVTRETFDAHGSALPDHERRRAAHYFTETSRVAAGAAAWRRGDLVEFGRQMTSSGLSSIDNYECGCAPMNDLRAIAAGTPGVFGARFSGAGFRGCCVALARVSDAQLAAASIRAEYAAAHPELAPCAHVIVTRTGPGAGARSL